MSLILTFRPGLTAEDFRISAHVVDDADIKISFFLPADNHDGPVRLFRCTRPLSPDNLNRVRYPVTEFVVPAESLAPGFMDEFAAHNVRYYYLAESGSGSPRSLFSNMVSVTVPDTDLPRLSRPELWVDKSHFLLEVRDASRLFKKYPVILGRDPVKRKLNQDFATTPEGIYQIINRQPNSTFHRALDIDYPNAVDRIRYEFLKSRGKVPDGKGIGGEIQIHGQLRPSWTIDRNWTWGCIALRDEDIDEIFGHREIGRGVPVLIIGQAVSRADIASLRKNRTPEEIKKIQARLQSLGHYQGSPDGVIGNQTRRALGRYQLLKGYPVTCDLDLRTVRDLLGEK